jgi:hypothetical protein
MPGAQCDIRTSFSDALKFALASIVATQQEQMTDLIPGVETPGKNS